MTVGAGNQWIRDGQKRCRRCGAGKSLGEFWPDAKVSTGLSPWCKDCQRAATRRSREKHRDRYNASRRKLKEHRTCALEGCEVEFDTPGNKLYCSDRHQRVASKRRQRRRTTQLAGDLNAR